MGVEYRRSVATGRLSKVTSEIDGSRYNVSTVWKANIEEWQTVVLKEGFFGAFRPLLSVGAQDQKQASWVHIRVEEIAATCASTGWAEAKSKLINSDQYRMSADNGFERAIMQALGHEAD